MTRYHSSLIALTLAGLLGATACPAADSNPRKKIFAHFMACYPVAAAATAWHRMHDPPRTRHDGERKFDALGDRWRNWPLVPDGMKLDLEQAADLDIRRAMRAGLDGFAIDAWAGGENAKKYLSAMFEVAEAKNTQCIRYRL